MKIPAKRNFLTWYFVLVFLPGSWEVIDLHFEEKESGYFLRHKPQSDPYKRIPYEQRVTNLDDGSVLAIDRFAVFRDDFPASVIVKYGPFATKQTVPARYVLSADESDTVPSKDTANVQVSAHPVANCVPRDNPVVRVLFHVGSEHAVPPNNAKHDGDGGICIVLRIVGPNETTLTASCSPHDHGGACMAEVVIPSSWWTPLPPLDHDGQLTKPYKSPPKMIQLSYSVVEPKEGWKGGPLPVPDCASMPRIQVQPPTKIASIPLVSATSGYKQMRLNDNVMLVIPQATLYPGSKVYVHTYIRFNAASFTNKKRIGLVIKARAKNAAQILTVECHSDKWSLRFAPGSENGAAAVATLLSKKATEQDSDQSSESFEDVVTWLLKMDAKSSGDKAKLLWNVRYIDYESPPSEKQTKAPTTQSSDGKALVHFKLQKDVTQAVIPITKNWEMVNTALLTGKQVSKFMRVFVVSHEGKISEVTRQSTCRAQDESVLKVTSSCSSIYTDGSETKGSANASIIVQYEGLTSMAQFVVWVPDLQELDIVLSDAKLSLIKDWLVPQRAKLGNMMKRSVKDWNYAENQGSDMKNTCVFRYQQATVDVYARFQATDDETGRVNYLMNRKTWFKITDLVASNLRSADSKVAIVQGRVVQGIAAGQTNVQLLSAVMGGKIIGSREIKVTNEKVTITRLIANVVTGLQLNILPDYSIDNGYIAQTTVTRKLSTQYQEGILDIDVVFSDGTFTPFEDLDIGDYSLSVESLNPSIVAFAPKVSAIHPRVISLAEGNGELLRVSFMLSSHCKASGANEITLTSAPIFVDVTFSTDVTSRSSYKPDSVQNDSGVQEDRRKDERMPFEFKDIVAAIPAPKDEISDDPSVMQHQHHRNSKQAPKPPIHRHHRSSPIEIGMYAILAVFSFAIVVFVVSCVVYASKFKPNDAATAVSNDRHFFSLGSYRPLQPQPPAPGDRGVTFAEPTTTNVHDWVWLGRATLERASGLLVPSITANSKWKRAGNRNVLRITTNPTAENASLLPGSHLDSRTFVVKKRPEKPLIPPPIPVHKEVLELEELPPVPPQRNVSLSSATFAKTPELPRRKHHHHRRKHHHHHRHGERIKLANIVENPMCLVDENESQPHTNRSTLGSLVSDEEMEALRRLKANMNYREIVEYFDNLEESNA